MSEEPPILHSVPTLSRAAGGLSVAVAELCTELAAQGANLDLLTHTTSPEERVPLGQEVGLVEVPGAQYFRTLIERYTQAEPPLIHQHGIWTAISRVVSNYARERAIPYLVSPHGMLEPWALQHKPRRKKLAMSLYQRRNLQDAAALLATSEQEANHLRELGFRQPIAVLPNGIQPVEGAPVDTRSPREQKVLFLSRIHPKKGLPMLLNAWAKLKPEGWKLVIAGNDEGGHQAETQHLASELGLAKTVEFPGPLYGEAKDAAFRSAALFVLPTYSENFGVVVGEALQYGVPVMTTTGTPWTLLEEQDCGWWVAPDEGALLQALDTALNLPEEQRRAMGERGMAVVEENFRWPTVARELLCVYQWLLDKGERPDCVMD